MNWKGLRWSIEEDTCDGSDKPMSSTTAENVLISQTFSFQEINLDIS